MGTNKEVAENWLRFAEDDLQVAHILLEEKYKLFSISMYHLHQAAEKAIKAMLIIEEIKFPKSHDLDKLITMLDYKKAVDSKLYDLISAFNDFNPEIRYPDTNILITDTNVMQALYSSTELIQIAKGKVNE